MLPFSPAEIVSKSIDGGTLTLTDNSNYADNSDNVADGDIATRQITGYDADDNLIGEVAQTQDTPVVWPLTQTADGFTRFHLVFTDNNTTVYTADVKFLSTRFYDNTQKNLAAFIRTNTTPKVQMIKLMDKALQLYNAAIDSFMTGDDVNAQLNIVDANIVINQAAALC